jgi:hypothetical protein
MLHTPNLTYEQVEFYIRNFRNAAGESVPYDVNGVIHFILAALDNLMEQWIDADFEQLTYSATAEQRQMLIKIGDFLKAFSPEPED